MDRLPENWQDKIHPEPNTGCWLWVGWDSGKGHGKVKVDGRACMAHRAIYEILVGPIPPGLVLDHLCRVRCCVNPDHLEPVTVQENTRRGEAVLYHISFSSGPLDRGQVPSTLVIHSRRSA